MYTEQEIVEYFIRPALLTYDGSIIDEFEKLLNS